MLKSTSTMSKETSQSIVCAQVLDFQQQKIAIKINSVFTGSSTENLLWYQQIDLRQIRILGGGQTMVDFDAADNCRLHVTIVKVMNIQDASPSISFDKFKGHSVQVFDLISTQYATENCQYPELVGQSLRLE